MGMPAYEAGLRGGLEVYSPPSLACPVGLRRTCQAAVHVLGSLKRVLPRSPGAFIPQRQAASFHSSKVLHLQFTYGHLSLLRLCFHASNE